MRTLAILVISSVLLAACGGTSPTSRTATPAATESGAEATPSPAPSATPALTETAEAVATSAAAREATTTADDVNMEAALRTCMTPDLPSDEAGAVNYLDECLNRGEGGYHVVGVTGDLPIILVERPGEPGLCRASASIVWRRDGWHVQNATVLLPDPVDDRVLGQYVVPQPSGPVPSSTFARQATEGDSIILSVLAGVASCGSGPGTVPMLFALDGDTWRLAWDPRGTELETLSDPRADFAEPTADRVHVRGLLWLTSGTNEIFWESHPGPHRIADQAWVRDGSRYVLAENRIEPSAYNTLYNFVYSLSTGDDGGASALLADPSLLDAAKQLGMTQRPLGQRWMTNLDANTQCCGPIRIASRAIDHAGPSTPIVVAFVQRGEDWLISNIAPESTP